MDQFIHESQAHAFEVELVERFGRRQFGGKLVNKTDGGEGCVGSVRSGETRAKISKALSGRIFDAEWRAKISAANRGRAISDEHRANLSAAGMGRLLTSEDKAKVTYASRCRPPKAGFKGVSKNGLGWRARIKLDGKLHHLGYFSTPEDAAMEYDASIGRFWGDGPWYRNFASADAVAA